MSPSHDNDGNPEEPAVPGALVSRPGYPERLVAVQRHGHLSVEPVQATGRYVVLEGRVMFLSQEDNHATALAMSGLRAPSGTPAGYYSVRQHAPGEPLTFNSVSAWAMGGNRVAPGENVIRAAAKAFLDSGYGDASHRLRR